MTALASLSKFYGCYDKWLQIRQRYSLKWSSGNNAIQSLQRFFDSDLTLDSMLSKIREMVRVLPEHMGEVIRFASITGLRPSEAVESVRLISGLVSGYYNQEQQCLQHYKFPDIFLRTTKKAYLSYLSLDNYQRIANLGPKTPTWNSIRLTCKRREIDMDMGLSRKVFASWLIAKSGIDSTTVDLLQGRCPPSVLARHYLVPESSLRLKVLDAVDKLKIELSIQKL